MLGVLRSKGERPLITFNSVAGTSGKLEAGVPLTEQDGRGSGVRVGLDTLNLMYFLAIPVVVGGGIGWWG